MPLPDLIFAGLRIVGVCKKCGFYIWGKEPKDEHKYCGVTPGKFHQDRKTL